MITKPMKNSHLVPSLKRQLNEAKRALKLAESIMSYCQGDRWERECTAEDRAKFNKIYEKIFGKESGA
jgi:hypothetical protein